MVAVHRSRLCEGLGEANELVLRARPTRRYAQGCERVPGRLGEMAVRNIYTSIRRLLPCFSPNRTAYWFLKLISMQVTSKSWFVLVLEGIVMFQLWIN